MFLKGKWRPKETVRSKSLNILLKIKNNRLWGCDKTKGFELQAVHCGIVTRKYMGKLMEDNCYFLKLVHTDPFQHQLPVSGDKHILLFLIQTQDLSYGKFYDLLLSKKGRSERWPLPFLKHLPLKVISMLKWHIWWWHFLNPFICEGLFLHCLFLFHATDF